MEADLVTETDTTQSPVACVMHSIAVQTACFDEAFRFYTEVVGLRVVREPFQFKTRTLCWLDGESALIELYSVKQDAEVLPYFEAAVGIEHVAFTVRDLDAMVDRLNRFEVKIVKGPLLPPSGDPRQPRVLFVEGPDGLSVQFREPARDIPPD